MLPFVVLLRRALFAFLFSLYRRYKAVPLRQIPLMTSLPLSVI